MHWFLIPTVLYSLVTGQCLPNCDCTSQPVGTLKIDCEGRDYGYFPLGVVFSENAGVLNFRHNNIQRLQTHQRGVRRQVWNIDLSHNFIKELLADRLGKTFPNLLFLDFSNNKIQRLTKKSFEHLSQVKGLYLTSNQLKIIDLSWFSHLLELKFLGLGDNDIHLVQESNSSWPSALTSLDLSTNKLRMIPPLPEAAEVSLLNNSLFCGCLIQNNKRKSIKNIKVDCYSLRSEVINDFHSFTKSKLRRILNETTWNNYKSFIPICKPAQITDFSYFLSVDGFVLKCSASVAFPKAVLHLRHSLKEMIKSKDNFTLLVKETGRYSCHAENYISSDKKDIMINPVITFTPKFEHDLELHVTTKKAWQTADTPIPSLHHPRSKDNTG